MTNWTTNELTVKGERDELEDFRNRVKGTGDDGDEVEFLLSSLVPEPDLSPLMAAPSEGPVDPDEVLRRGGDSWRVLKWGTRTEAIEANVEPEKEQVTYKFLTAWSAPLPWLETVSRMFPGLVFEFEYQEEGSEEDEEGVYIKCVFRDGRMVEADQAAERDLRVASMEAYLLGDPWLLYFFSHPEEFERAAALLAGPAPDEIEQWIEAKQTVEGFLVSEDTELQSKADQDEPSQAGES